MGVGLHHPTWGRKLWRTYQDGWSPTLLALQAHLQFIEELRSHMGFGKYLALSYQNKEKHTFSKRMWPFGQKNTHTHK